MIFRNIASFVVTATSLLAVSACTPQGSNQWVPKGYTYQDDTPLTSPAPSSPWLKEAEISNTDALADNTTAWQGASYELLDGLSASLPPSGAPVYVSQIAPITNQDLALDHYIRQALMSKNITLTTSENIAPTLLINAEPLTKQAILDDSTKMGGFEYVEGMDLTGLFRLTAKLVAQDGIEMGQSSTVAMLPHEKVEYSRLPGYSMAPVTGISNDTSPVYNK